MFLITDFCKRILGKEEGIQLMSFKKSSSLDIRKNSFSIVSVTRQLL